MKVIHRSNFNAPCAAKRIVLLATGLLVVSTARTSAQPPPPPPGTPAPAEPSATRFQLDVGLVYASPSDENDSVAEFIDHALGANAAFSYRFHRYVSAVGFLRYLSATGEGGIDGTEIDLAVGLRLHVPVTSKVEGFADVMFGQARVDVAGSNASAMFYGGNLGIHVPINPLFGAGVTLGYTHAGEMRFYFDPSDPNGEGVIVAWFTLGAFVSRRF